MERISKLLGHGHIDTTRIIYAKPSVETLRPAAELIDQRIKKITVQTAGSVLKTAEPFEGTGKSQ
jgi:hypothetical protein